MKTKNTISILVLVLFTLPAGLSYSIKPSSFGPWKGKVRSYNFHKIDEEIAMQSSWRLSVSAYSKNRKLSVSFIISGCEEGLLGNHKLLGRHTTNNCVRSPDIPFSFITRENGKRKEFVPISGTMNVSLEKDSSNYNHILFNIHAKVKESGDEANTKDINVLVTLKLDSSEEGYHLMMPRATNQQGPSESVQKDLFNPRNGDLIDDDTRKFKSGKNTP